MSLFCSIQANTEPSCKTILDIARMQIEPEVQFLQRQQTSSTVAEEGCPNLGELWSGIKLITQGCPTSEQPGSPTILLVPHFLLHAPLLHEGSRFPKTWAAWALQPCCPAHPYRQEAELGGGRGSTGTPAVAVPVAWGAAPKRKPGGHKIHHFRTPVEQSCRSLFTHSGFWPI